MQTVRVGTLSIVIAVLFGNVARAQQAPQITSITGYSDAGGGVLNGRWTGQPANAPATASNQYRNRLACDTYAYPAGSTNPYYWDINGQNFGSNQGTVTLGPNPSPFTHVIVSWSNTRIRIRPTAFPEYTTSGVRITVRTAATPQYPQGRTTVWDDQAVALIKSRGYGQCTWFVASRRRGAGRTIPLPSAYSTTGSISAVGSVANGYEPAQWDALNYNGNHVAIISTVPVRTFNANGTVTWSFTVREMNATWNEAESSSSRTFTLSAPDAMGRRRVVTGIGTNASNTWVATGYYR